MGARTRPAVPLERERMRKGRQTRNGCGSKAAPGVQVTQSVHTICAHAAKNGKVIILKWVHEQGLLQWVALVGGA